MTKSEFNMLGKLFKADMFNQLPFQTKSKMIKKLEEQGIAEYMERRIGIVLVKGYQLSELGHMTYCMNC